jgi:hypothetical protein
VDGLKAVPEDLDFRRSTFCESSACVEVAQMEQDIVVRQSEHPDRPLVLSRPEWEAFRSGLLAGEFDF